jgi:hypothetical protein
MRGQGLPITLVVLTIIALVILVLAIIFIIIPILHTPTPTTNSNPLVQFKFDCSTYCGNPSDVAPPQTEFCTKSISYNGQALYCYSPSVGAAPCSYQENNGTFWSNIGQSLCS